MDSWTSCLLAFGAGIGAGIAVGIALVSLKPYIFAAKKKRTELVVARSRILAGIKEKHEEEILDEAFRTTEAIIQAVYPASRRLSLKVRTFLDFLVERLACEERGGAARPVSLNGKPHAVAAQAGAALR